MNATTGEFRFLGWRELEEQSMEQAREQARRVRVDGDGVTLTRVDFEYFIAWNRLKTQRQLLGWLEHLSKKDWFTMMDVTAMITAVSQKRGWDIYGA